MCHLCQQNTLKSIKGLNVYLHTPQSTFKSNHTQCPRAGYNNIIPLLNINHGWKSLHALINFTFNTCSSLAMYAPTKLNYKEVYEVTDYIHLLSKI